MTERLLQYIWQFQHFNNTALTSIEAEWIQVIHQGQLNHNQGPDFLNAKIKLGETTWAGSIELHIRSSDWKNHKHTADKNYNNVILHVVWQHDIDLKLPFSTLILADRVSKLLLVRYEELMNAAAFIPCEKRIGNINAIILLAWKERLLVERLQKKAQLIFNNLQKNNFHWEETLWWQIARNFGVKVNCDAFEAMAQSLPLAILAKHKHQLIQVEALLFGQAGLLEADFTEAYPRLLKREFNFLKNKYQLPKAHMSMNFLLMRPSNFPTVRLAQLAALIHKSEHLFSKIKAAGSTREIQNLLQLTANDYWHYHYVFDELAAYKKKNLGQPMINAIMINSIAPVVFAYGVHLNENSYKKKAMDWLMDIPAEQNNITKGFAKLGIISKNAFDTQALLQLKNEYCTHKHCLDCSIGSKLLKDH